MTLVLGRAQTRLTLLIAVLVAVSSAVGLFSGAVYQRETATWAAQGRGQDAVDLFIVLPALLITTFYARRGRRGAVAVWRGMLLYLIYSYVLYAFFMHFNLLFLVYVSTLGVLFYTLLASMIDVDRQTSASWFIEPRTRKLVSAFMLVCCSAFTALWLGEILPSLWAGTMPASAVAVGLPVNPVHVLDLAVVLPGMMITAVMLWRNISWGLLWAAPLLVFMIVMGIAILGMSWSMFASGQKVPVQPVAFMSAVVIAAAWLARRFLNEYRGIILTG